MIGEVKLFVRANGADIGAELFDTVSLDDFNEAQALWRPILLQASEIMRASGKAIPRYKHWDWSTKSRFLGRLDVTFFGIRCDNRLQGLMKADVGTVQRCRLDVQKGKELVYVDYLETAPWNIAEYMRALERRTLYGRVGVRLMQAAIRLSLENELKGRIGLHSLPAAEDFYRKMGMNPLHMDPQKQNLIWFEFTSEAANQFLEKYI